MSLPGPGVKPTIAQQLQVMKAMARMDGKDVLPGLVMPRKRTTHPPRAGHSGHRKQPERDIANSIIDWLRLAGCKVGIIKVKGSYLSGRHLKDRRIFKSVPDILCYYPKTKTWWWIETKAGYNKLTKRQPEHDEHEYSQEEFRDWCLESSTNHIVAKELKDVFVITGNYIEDAGMI